MNDLIKELNKILKDEPDRFEARLRLAKLILKVKRANKRFAIISLICIIFMLISYFLKSNSIFLITIFTFSIFLLDFITIKVAIDTRIINRLKKYKIDIGKDKIVLSKML